MAVFRVERNKGYTVMSNHHLRNKELTLKLFSDKFDITKHPKYKYLSDADPKNAFDMEKHIKRRPAIVKPDEEFDVYEIDGEDLQEDAENE